MNRHLQSVRPNPECHVISLLNKQKNFFYLEPKLESESELESELIGLSPEPMKIKPPQKILDLPLRTGIYR